MQRLAFRPKYTIPALLLTIMCGMIFLRTESLLLHITATISFFLFFGYFFGQYILPKEPRSWQVFWGVIGLLTSIITILSFIYWLFGWNTTMMYTVLASIPCLVALLRERQSDLWEEIRSSLDFSNYEATSSFLGTKLLSFLLLWGFILLFVTLIDKRTTDTIISPWTFISTNVLIFFAFLTCALLIVAQQTRDTSTTLFLTVLYTTAFFSVSLIIYRFGFGFDQILHQAAEKWIAAHGFIAPKTPYYIGQYMLTLLLSTLTRVPIETIDRGLVPLGAGILLPLSLYFGFSRRTFQTSLLGAIAVLPFPVLSFFIVTTPNNLAMLVGALIIAWMWFERDEATKKSRTFGLLLCAGSLVIHPFIGVPITSIYIGSLFFGYIKKTGWQTFITIGSSALVMTALPALFIINGFRIGEPITVVNPFDRLTPFLTLFQIPYWYWMRGAPLLWQMLYVYKLVLIPLFLGIALLGYLYARKLYKEPFATYNLVMSGSLFVSAFVLSTALKFPNIISYEQQVYANRVIELSLLLLLPLFIIAVREIFVLLHKSEYRQYTAAVVCALLLTVSWYFTYPTRDPVSRFTGYSIRQADIQAVHFIDQRNPKRDYIVLSNQTIAATAIREFGFAKYISTVAGEQFFYSIPTGGPMYQFFRKMVYEEPKRVWMEEAMRYAGVKKAYFVHTNYWAPAAIIRDQAKLEADYWWDIGDGRVWVYEYTIK